MMFLALDLNRRNINRAITDNMLPELGMDTNDFNYGQTIFLVSFLAAELPSGLISKKLGPDIWIPSIIFAWSVVSAAQAGLTNRAGYYTIRCLLGLLMGGFIPDTVRINLATRDWELIQVDTYRCFISLTGTRVKSYPSGFRGSGQS